MPDQPTIYDLIQDGRLDAIEGVVSSHYDPPEGPEYSFPVVGQGVSFQQFQLISRAAGTGVYVQHDAEGAQSPYRLTDMPGGPAETNAQNKMMLRVSSLTKRSEAAIEGFFHAQTQDIPISLPAVAQPTTYRVCLTLDPRNEDEPGGPVSVQVYTTEPPTTYGRRHIILWTVQRNPNELLTDATVTQTRPWLGHVINVWHENQLPDPTQVEYGTLAVVINANRPKVFTSRGVWGWIPVSSGPIGDWVNITSIRSSWQRYSSSWPCRARRTPSGVQIDAVLKPDDNAPGTMSSTSNMILRLPSSLRPRTSDDTQNSLVFAALNNNDAPIPFRLTNDGDLINLKPWTTKAHWIRFHGEIFF